MQKPYNRDYETDNVPDNEQNFHEPPDMSHVHLETCLHCDMPVGECECDPQPFFVVEKFEQDKSIGYFDGGDALRGFTTIIDCALQFRRKQDAQRVADSLFGNVKATEHIYMARGEDSGTAPMPTREQMITELAEAIVDQMSDGMDSASDWPLVVKCVAAAYDAGRGAVGAVPEKATERRASVPGEKEK